jgi:thiol-disulfide isomerase/thioredoxin
MRAVIATLAIVLGLAATAAAQDGGKLTWRARNGDPKTAMLDAKDKNKPIMLYFMSAGCPYCKELEDGAFSDARVVEATVNIECIWVDCDWGKKNQELAKKYGVKGYPSVILCDPQGNYIIKAETRDAEMLAKGFKILWENVGAKAEAPLSMLVGNDYEKARIEARRLKKPLLIYFGDFSPASVTINDSLMDRSLQELWPKFITAKFEFTKGSVDANRFGVTRAPTLLVLDSSFPRPEEKPLARIEGSRTPRELKRELEAALPSREAGPLPGAADLPSVRRDAPEEKLSDDAIERKFIWARVAVAQDTLKRGNKDKAIEILEDVLKSYPKHKDTEDVRKVLEEMRKK